MAKVELTEKKQAKASAWFKRIEEIETYRAALERKQDSAKTEKDTLLKQLQDLNVDYFTVIDEVAANTINNKRRVIKDRIADLDMVLAMDVKAIVRGKLFHDDEFKELHRQSQNEYIQFRDEVDAEIKALEKQIEQLEELRKEHKHIIADQLVSNLRSRVRA